MNQDLYAVLGVSTDADPAVIRAAYLALIRLHHPDTASDAAARLRAEQRTKDLNAAYAVLSDPSRRANYDELRRRPRMAAIHQPGMPPKATAKTPTRRRKGPSLQERRERLQRVRLLSVGLALVAVLLIFGAFTGVVGMVRPSMPEWLTPGAGLVSSPREELQDLSAVPLDVMLPWPSSEEQRSLGAAGLRLSFPPITTGENPVAVIVDDRGAQARVEGAVTLSPEQTNYFGIGRLAGAGAPPIVIVATPSGQDCCLHVRVIHSSDGRLKVGELGEVPNDVAERFPSDVNGDGVREWVLPDRRFTATFGSSGPAPPMMFRFDDGRFRNVSASGDYGETYSNHLAPAQRLCTLGSSGACAAFVASAARLGKVDWAWQIMLRNYGRDRVHDASEFGSDPGVDAADCMSPTSNAFPARLRRFLLEAGYIKSADGLNCGPAILSSPRS